MHVTRVDLERGRQPLHLLRRRAQVGVVAAELAESCLPLGKVDRLVEIGEALSPSDGVEEAFVMGAAIVAMQLFLAGRHDVADALMARLDAAEARLSTASPLAGMLATGVHTVAYLAVTGLIAWVVYRKLGLALLRKAWLNFDLVWAAALVATGIVTLLM